MSTAPNGGHAFAESSVVARVPGMPAVATRLDASCDDVRQRLIKEGVQLRLRGDTYTFGRYEP